MSHEPKKGIWPQCINIAISCKQRNLFLISLLQILNSHIHGIDHPPNSLFLCSGIGKKQTKQYFKISFSL